MHANVLFPVLSVNVYDFVRVIFRNSSFWGEIRIQYLMILTRSSAEVPWTPFSSWASRPFGVIKYVEWQPISSALCVHHLRKVLYTATDMFRYDYSSVVVALEHHGVQHVFKCVLLAVTNPKSDLRHLGCIG